MRFPIPPLLIIMKSLKDFNINNKRVLVRSDFNVPLDDKQNILDDFRLRESLLTIKYLIENRAKIILMSHLDPESTGLVNPIFKLDKVAEKLSEYLGFAIAKADDCIGPALEGQSNNLEAGQILLLENLRFHKEESRPEGYPDLEFAKKLSYLGDIYVNDSFSVCHRAHASIVGLPEYLPSCIGLLLEKELNNLNKILKSSERPMIAIVGGKKVETKAKFIDKISQIADCVIISGLLKKEVQDKKIVFLHPEKILGPDDSLDALDIDQKTIDLFCEKILQAKTILWNGPFGKFEDEKYAKGTLSLAQAIIESKAFSVVGGGETVEFLKKQGMIEKFSHVSTGGGAMMAYLAGDKLPGLEALK